MLRSVDPIPDEMPLELLLTLPMESALRLLWEELNIVRTRSGET